MRANRILLLLSPAALACGPFPLEPDGTDPGDAGSGVESCSTDDVCGVGRVCRGGSCVAAGCLSNADCPGATCDLQTGLCRTPPPQCTTDAQCHPPLTICSGGTCIAKSCTRDTHCPGAHCDAASGTCRAGLPPAADAGPGPVDAGPGPGPGPADAGPGGPLGAACGTDADCADGTCLDLPGGYCTRGGCDSAGCPAGGECYELEGGSVSSACFKTCTAASQCRQSEGYVCDSDSTCYPGDEPQPADGGTPATDGGNAPAACPAGLECFDTGSGGACVTGGDDPFPPGARSCGGGTRCAAGFTCYLRQSGDATGLCLQDCDVPPPPPAGDIGPGPGAGPGPDCPNLPPMGCSAGTTQCSQLAQFSPTSGDGYVDYPENGETAQNQYRSWLRRDFMQLVKFATAKVACKTAAWQTGNGGPVGLIDMSEQNGAIPGTSIGQPGHPTGTHTNGRDIDIAYFQRSTANNRARPVCAHTSGGQDAYHCTADPTTLDAWREAAFMGFLLESPPASPPAARIRVIGMDGRVGPMVHAAFDRLCTDGWITRAACGRRSYLTYEQRDEGRGWYLFHHHHTHVSSGGSYRMTWPDPFLQCIVPGCGLDSVNAFRRSVGAPPFPEILEWTPPRRLERLP